MLPIMTEALSGMVQQAQFAHMQRTSEQGDFVESAESVQYYLGTLQPINPRKLIVKPEGWRVWKWYDHVTTRNMELGDYVRDPRGIQYKVMSKQDWSQAGFYKYELVESSTMGSMAS